MSYYGTQGIKALITNKCVLKISDKYNAFNQIKWSAKMSKLMKLCVMHCVIVMLLIGAVSVANKIIISPLRTQFQTAHTKIAELNEQLVDMNKNLKMLKVRL